MRTDAKDRIVATGRLKVGGVLVTEHLGMISVQGTEDAQGIAGTILESLGAAGINTEFISCCPDIGGGATICVSVAMDRFDSALDLVEGVREDVGAQRIVTEKDLCAVVVFGPHFRETPNIASRIYRALADAGINILAVSTSVSSVSSVFAQSRLGDALASLRSHFDIP